MRVVIQRVSEASVSVDGRVAGKIGNGLLILLGVENEDNDSDIEWLVRKITSLRIFNDNAGIMNLSVQETGGSFLVVSQFTLHASTKKGNRPSWIKAAAPDFAGLMYGKFIDELEKISGKRIETGKFGAMMEVKLVNDGPVTIIIDSKNRE